MTSNVLAGHVAVSYTHLSRRIGFTGNLNYIYDNRYFIDMSYRIDGSSLFGTKNKFAPFWSVGMGWNIHNEDVYKRQPRNELPENVRQ